MIQDLKIYDSWRSSWSQLLASFICIGFSLGFWRVMSMSRAWDAQPEGRWIIYPFVATAGVLGILILLPRQIVTLDPVHQRLSRINYLLYIPISRRIWALAELQHVEVEFEYDEGYGCRVGIVPASEPTVWLRSFMVSATGPSKKALAFAREVAEITGLPCEVNDKTRKSKKLTSVETELPPDG